MGRIHFNEKAATAMQDAVLELWEGFFKDINQLSRLTKRLDELRKRMDAGEDLQQEVDDAKAQVDEDARRCIVTYEEIRAMRLSIPAFDDWRQLIHHQTGL